MEEQNNKVYIGTSSYDTKWWISKAGNRSFIPEGNDPFTFYSYNYPSIEIDVDKCKKLSDQCKLWYDQSPEGFTFSLKVVLHGKKMIDFQEWCIKFELDIASLKEKLVAVLFEAPLSFRKTRAHLQKLEDMQNAIQNVLPDNVIYAFEFSDITWYEYDEEVDELFSEPGFCFVHAHAPNNNEVLDKFSQPSLGNLKGGHNPPPFRESNLVEYHKFHGSEALGFGSYGYEYLASLMDTDRKIFMYFDNADSWCPVPKNEGRLVTDKCESIPWFICHRNLYILPSSIYDVMCCLQKLKDDESGKKYDDQGYRVLEFYREK